MRMWIVAVAYHLLALTGLFFVMALWHLALGAGAAAVLRAGGELGVATILVLTKCHPSVISLFVAITVGLVVCTECLVAKTAGAKRSFRVLGGCVACCFAGLTLVTFVVVATEFGQLPYYALTAPDAVLRPYHLLALASGCGTVCLVLSHWGRRTVWLGLFLLMPIVVLIIVLFAHPGEYIREAYRMELPASYPEAGRLGIAFAIVIATWAGLRWLGRWAMPQVGSEAALIVAGLWSWVLLAVSGVGVVATWWYSSCGCISDPQSPLGWFKPGVSIAFACLWIGILVVQWARYWRLRHQVVEGI